MVNGDVVMMVVCLFLVSGFVWLVGGIMEVFFIGVGMLFLFRSEISVFLMLRVVIFFWILIFLFFLNVCVVVLIIC